jgi:HAD superfamily hydrolase (TIGR01490 family)
MTIAVFDLDYTLTQRGTWGRFVWRTVRARPWFWLPLLLETLRDQIEYKAGRRPRGAVKRSMMRWSLMRRTRADLEAMAEVFATEEVPAKLRPGGLAALAYHRTQGDHILIASAAVDLIVEPIGKRLNVDGVVCTQMAWSGEHLEDRFASDNCYGDAKRDAVTAYLKAHNLSGPTVFYTDSRADFALLSIMDQTIVVDPKTKTRLEAQDLNLPIQNWSNEQNGFSPVSK